MSKELFAAPNEAVTVNRSSPDADRACNERHFVAEETYVMGSSPRRYSLLCHITRTRIVVGGEGVHLEEMIPAITSDDAMQAFCAFLMHNRRRPLYLHAESLTESSKYSDYYEFSAWSQEAPPAWGCD